MGESCNWTNVLSEGANLANLIFIKIDNAISMMSRGGLNCCFKLITSSSNAVYTYLKCNFIPISIYAEFSWNRFPSHTELIDIQLTLLLKVLYYDKLCGKNEILYNIIKKIGWKRHICGMKTYTSFHWFKKHSFALILMRQEGLV